MNLLILLIVILVLCRKGTKNFSFCNLCGCLKFREYYMQAFCPKSLQQGGGQRKKSAGSGGQ